MLVRLRLYRFQDELGKGHNLFVIIHWVSNHYEHIFLYHPILQLGMFFLLPLHDPLKILNALFGLYQNRDKWIGDILKCFFDEVKG